MKRSGFVKLRKPRSPLKKIQTKAKKSLKKAVVPGYGKGGATAIKDPAKFITKKLSGQPLSKTKKKKGFFSLFK